MSDLGRHLHDYLTMRRALGFKLMFPGQVLPQFVRYLEAAGASTVTAELAITWAGLPAGVQPISLAHRLGAVRWFARYLATIDPTTEVPPCRIWPSVTRRPTPLPVVRHRGPSLARRDAGPASAVAGSDTRDAVRSARSSGMRIGETLGLDRNDVELANGVITVREAKSGRTRLVPLHPSTTDALGAYADATDYAQNRGRRRSSSPVPAPRWPTAACTRHSSSSPLLSACELPPRGPGSTISGTASRSAPLIDWHRSGVDIEGRMAVLSNYLGHMNPSGTYWYLSASPELMELAAARLETRFGAQS